MRSRIKKIIAGLHKTRLQAYWITDSTNISYLTGFASLDSWLLITPKKVFYITDSRYTLEAKEHLKDIEILESPTTLKKTFCTLLLEQKLKRVGFDEQHISVAHYRQLLKSSPKGVKFIADNALIEEMREVKEKEEVDQIKACIKLNLSAYRYCKRLIKPGVTEQKILRSLEEYVKGKGARFSFDPIIASGPNSAMPHARVTRRKIRKNDVVLVDMGIEIGGYKSDLTRMFFLGKIAPHVREVFECVRVAQQTAIKKIRPGIRACSIDKQARNYLKKKKLDQFFGHSLGHGVGLQIHEGPRISSKSQDTLKEGMIFTVEPGVYIADEFGIRIEDMVLVTKNGCSILS